MKRKLIITMVLAVLAMTAAEARKYKVAVAMPKAQQSDDIYGQSFSDWFGYTMTELGMTTDMVGIFAAGFRSYPTVHRNFVKFKGCSPTEYTEKFS